MRAKAVAVIVTYADRWHLLSEVLRAVIPNENIAACVVVNNGSSYSVHAELEKAALTSHVVVIEMGENKGSASGYSAGIRYAVQTMGADWIFMLDDDNRPEEGALEVLLGIASADPSNRTCALALRNDRPEQLKALCGGPPLTHTRNSFSGFHVRNLFRSIHALRQANGPPNSEEPGGQTQVDFAPYGGLLIPRAVTENVADPLTEYFVYADDHEYTTRITKAGYKIVLSASARVEDLETSWHLKKNGAPPLFSSAVPMIRLAYSVRNRVNFERRHLVTSPPIYLFNAAIFVILRLVRSLVAEKHLVPVFYRAAKYLAYALDGWHGRLGRIVRS